MAYHLFRAALRHGIILNLVPPPDDDNNPGGGGGGGGAGTRERTPSQAVQSAIMRHGGAEQALGAVMAENYAYRARHRSDKQRIAQLEEAAQKGGIKVTKEQMNKLTAYEALGSPEDLKKAKEEGDAAKEQVKRYEKQAFHAEVAEAVEWNPKVLDKLIGDEGIHIEFKDIQVDDGKGGKATRRVPHARKADKADAALVPLTDYVSGDATLKLFLPALQAAGDAAQGGGARSQGGLRVHGQQPASPKSATGGASGSRVQQAIEANRKRAEAPNVLRPQAASAQGSE